jgi:hypothetical protein
MLILEAFLESIGHRMYMRFDTRNDMVLHFGRPRAARHSVRLDRYIIYKLQRVMGTDGLVAPDRLKQHYAPTLAAFMEGSLVESNGQRRMPRYAAERAAALVANDMSSWDEELCLFTGESALIYCPLIGRGVAYIGGPLGLSGHAYTHYWDGIVRGIQHVVAFHAEIQQTERRTTNLLSAVPVLTRKVNEGELSAEDVVQIDHLATSLSDIFASLPEQRSMAVSSSAFRADYVRRKFVALMHELDVQETLELVNTNVEQLNFFLSYYGDMRLQWQSQRTNDTNTLISEIVMFMALSSFAADTFQVGNAFGLNITSEILLVVGILILLGLILGLGWLRRIIRLRR